MREWKWNEAETNLLRGLSLLAQALYLRVFRERMDFATGIVGGQVGKNKIFYFVLAEQLCFVPDFGSNKKPYEPSTSELRSAIRELERVNLIVDYGSNRKNGIVKKLLFASTDESVKNRNDTGTTPRNNTKNDTSKANKNAALNDGNDTGNDSKKSRGTTAPPVSGKNNTHHACETALISDSWQPEDWVNDRLRMAGCDPYDQIQLMSFVAHHRKNKTRLDSNFNEMFIIWVGRDFRRYDQETSPKEKIGAKHGKSNASVSRGGFHEEFMAEQRRSSAEGSRTIIDSECD